MDRRAFLAAASAGVAVRSLGAAVPAPYGAIPSQRQLGWHELETTAFLHFTVNTFTDKEWGYGDEDPNLFAPARFDADAIVEPLAQAGMKGVILTAKHHDGFCLWPTATTEHSVRSSEWRGGRGDGLGKRRFAEPGVTDALAQSPNTAFARLIQQVGVQRAVDMAVKLGLRSYAEPGTARAYDPKNNESLADFIKRQNLGSFTLGPFELNALELSNVANLPITLYPGMKIGQISFLKMTTPAAIPYGSAVLGSKYQHQRGPTPSRYWQNFVEDKQQ